MILSQISPNQGHLSLNRSTQTTSFELRDSGPEKWVGPHENDQSESVEVSKTHYEYTRLQAVNSGFNSVAANIRVAESTMEAIQDQVSRMKNRLEKHIKNFPPFPPGCEERVKLLKSFNSFRKEIDKMTIPPNHDYAMKIMADPSVSPEAGAWEIAIGENGPSETIQSKEVHTGPTGLDIPELPEDASDDTIHEVISKIDNAIDTLKRAKDALSRDISGIAQLKKYVNQQDDIPEFTAEAKSIEIKHTLANGSGMHLTETPLELIDFLSI